MVYICNILEDSKGHACSCVVIGGFQSILFVSAFRCWGHYDYNNIIDNLIYYL